MSVSRSAARLAAAAFAVGALALLGGCTQPNLKPAQLLVALPDYCNTPDGMALLPDNSFILSVPNYNNEKQPPLLMRITPDNKAELWYKLPTVEGPCPVIYPMGISCAPSGDLYLADMQSNKSMDQKSRMWRIAVKDGKPEKLVLVAKGFIVANGTTVHDGYVYITESVLEDGSHPLTSAVMRFKLGEENVQLKTPLKDDPHVIATFKSLKNDWRFGADGIAFDSKGNLFVGLFGEGEIWKIEFDPQGNVKSNKLFAKASCMKTCDGMSCDVRTDRIYLADSANNAIQIINPDGTVETLARNGDFKDKLKGKLTQPCEAMVRGNTVVASNMNWPFPGFRSLTHRLPATLSVIQLDPPPAK